LVAITGSGPVSGAWLRANLRAERERALRRY
jgi:hypothetical protein